jgi:class 3 adenylate cyclase
MASTASTASEQALVELMNLRQLVDETLEEALLRRWSLAETMDRMLPLVGEKAGATAGFVQSYGEDLTLQLFRWPADLAIPDDVFARTADGKRESVALDVPGGRLVAQPLDVAGTWFGCAGLVVPRGADVERAKAQLNLVCEVLDNFLFAIRAAREKHTVMMELGNALRHRVLSEGLKQAVGILARAVPLDRMLLVFLAEENATNMLHVQVYEKGALQVDTTAAVDQSFAPVRALARDYITGKGRALLEKYGLENAQEEVLINGITNSVVVGKVVVTSTSGSFNTYDRELLSGFAGFIRQRVVDFNKEWRVLAHSFRPDDVAHLLQSDDYEKQYLAPREETVAILYVDIAGFTKLSEQVLKTPAKVAALVEDWSREAVDLVWEHGGVFDKMVGDCIIALFGPPFYRETPGERLAAAVRCAVAIRQMTGALPKRAQFAHLAEIGVAVSTGVNLAPLFVGTFGPNANFTGFSSGMNNTARLQGCAKRDEILVMDEAIAHLPKGHAFAFGDVQSAAVKNVAEPLRFRPLK